VGIGDRGPDVPGPDVPAPVVFEACMPNPLTTGTVIRYSVTRATRVRLEVFDVLGRRVGSLVDEPKLPGSYAETWNARDLPGGTYFLKLQAGGPDAVAGAAVRLKLILVR
jgi:hypothetical protein